MCFVIINPFAIPLHSTLKPFYPLCCLCVLACVGGGGCVVGWLVGWMWGCGCGGLMDEWMDGWMDGYL